MCISYFINGNCAQGGASPPPRREILNSKHEIRMKLEIRKTERSNPSKRHPRHGRVWHLPLSTFRILDFLRISNFGFFAKWYAYLSIGVLLSGSAPAAESNAISRVEELTWGPIHLTMTFTPPAVRLDRDVLLALRVTAPQNLEAVIPPLDDRLQGLALGGRFERDPVTRDGVTTREIQCRLTPLVAAEYRLAPFPVAYTDTRVDPPVSGWFPTRPVVLAVEPLVSGDPGSALQGALKPVWIRPPLSTVAWGVVLVLVVLAAAALLWRLLRRVREEVAVRRLSPRERALRELQQLLARDLIARGQVKEFYVELTFIVRRYIERRHGVRAPEQTTEEFLGAISQDARFRPEVLSRLRAFLRAADMVKFAAHRPDAAAIEQASGTAKEYIEHDDQEAKPGAVAPETR